jgi:hypothetical protein
MACNILCMNMAWACCARCNGPPSSAKWKGANCSDMCWGGVTFVFEFEPVDDGAAISLGGEIRSLLQK